jgi:hypothetical protein
MFALIEIWITLFTTSIELLDSVISVPTGFSLLSFPRPACPKKKTKLLVEALLFMISDKIHEIHTVLLSNDARISPHIPPPFTSPNFSSFTDVTTHY